MPDDPTATPTELHWLTIADAARLIERHRLSPVELTDALIARILKLDAGAARRCKEFFLTAQNHTFAQNSALALDALTQGTLDMLAGKK